MGRWGLGLVLGMVVACGAAPEVDEDGDGVLAAEDCDDSNPAVRPGTAEVCNGIDDDCNGDVDDDDAGLAGARRYYADADDDSYGGVDLGTWCQAPDNAVERAGDCADDVAAVNPGAVEVCDSTDNDCDEAIDDADDNLNDPEAPRWFKDKDLDTFGSSSDTVLACASPGTDWATRGGDCDDTDDERNPEEPEICDGKDNNCDVLTGLLIDDADPLFVGGGGGATYYRDRDLDGYGSGQPVADCDGGPGLVTLDGDCDDTKKAVNPGAAEICDGIDNDCDGKSDDDQWWDTQYAYRIPITVTAPNRVSKGPVVTVTVSPTQALADLGDVGTPVAGTFRVVLQDCPKGFPQVPFDFVDAAVGLLDAGVSPVPAGPFNGTLVFRHDTDGNWATRENLPANGSESYALYFSSTTTGSSSGTIPTAGAFTYTPGATTVLQSDVSRLELSTAAGGLPSSFGLVGGANVGGSTGSAAGNGMYLAPVGGGGTAAWVKASEGAGATVTSIFQGDLAAVLRSTGVATGANGAYAYTITWLMVQSRPELYAKIAYTTSAPSHVGPQSPTWTSAVRPWQTDNQALLALGASTGFRDPAFRFVRATYDDDALGVVLGWRDFPLTPGNPVFSADGRYVGLVGQDFEAAPSATERDLGSSDAVVDNAVAVVVPYAGTWAANEVEALATVVGPRGTPRAAEASPAP